MGDTTNRERRFKFWASKKNKCFPYDVDGLCNHLWIKWTMRLENIHLRLLIYIDKFLLKKFSQICAPITSVWIIHFPILLSKILFNICKLEKISLLFSSRFDSYYICISCAYPLLIFQWRYSLLQDFCLTYLLQILPPVWNLSFHFTRLFKKYFMVFKKHRGFFEVWSLSFIVVSNSVLISQLEILQESHIFFWYYIT